MGMLCVLVMLLAGSVGGCLGAPDEQAVGDHELADLYVCRDGCLVCDNEASQADYDACWGSCCPMPSPPPPSDKPPVLIYTD